MAIKEGVFPWLTYPRSPGHEVVGTVDEVGAEVTLWKPGQRVGVGWHGGHCFVCEACRAGDFMTCAAPQVTGILFDGGYAEYMIAPQEGLARVPDELSAVEAASLLCAGITCFNALRNSGAGPGDLVAVQGVGGLGHLGVQYAEKFGFRTAAISSGASKRALAEDLGADIYIDASAEGPAEALQRLGGAQVILATAPDGPSDVGASKRPQTERHAAAGRYRARAHHSLDLGPDRGAPQRGGVAERDGKGLGGDDGVQRPERRQVEG